MHKVHKSKYKEEAALFNWFKKDKQKEIDQQADDAKVSTASEDAADVADTESTVNVTQAENLQTSQSADNAENAESKETTESKESKKSIESTIDQQQADLVVSEPAPEAESPVVHEPQQQGFFTRLKTSLSRTKENIGSGFVALLKGKAIDEDLYEELETQLLIADVGMNTTQKIIKQLTEKAKLSQLKDGDALGALLKQQMREILGAVTVPLTLDAGKDEQGKKIPFVILMVGVNGVGKTTTIGKLAKQFQAQGKKVMLAAGDTFRAAAVEQLQVWGERNDIAVISQPTGADSASVIFDAVASAKARGVDVLIADTAGRLQNKDNLIEELKKVVRVMKKQIPEAPHEIMLTLDASTGQNAVSQTKIFNEAVGITGINLTKLDGTAKGGVIFALADEFNIPVRYIGIGEGIDDLRPFAADAFVDALFDEVK
jgi:fused signal recognition particle receptor